MLTNAPGGAAAADRRAYLRWACVGAAAAARPGPRSCCGRRPSESEQTPRHSWDVWSGRAPPRLAHRLEQTASGTNVLWGFRGDAAGVTAPGCGQLLSQAVVFFL